MKLLLDTHIAVWVILDSPRLSDRARDLIADPASDVYVSAVSLWEIAIKHALNRTGPDAMSVSAGQARAWFEASNFRSLPVTDAHAVAGEALPPHHNDPFDRLLIAQARTEPMRLLSHDAALAAYGELVVAV